MESLLANVRAQIEADRLWREQEMRLLRNQVSYLQSDDDRRRYRKALVVMLYAHFEGGTRTILQIFVDAVSSLGSKIGQANWALAVAGMSDIFTAFNNRDKKSRVFSNILPEDEKLHRFAREREFLERLHDFEGRPLVLDADALVDTESNLKPRVLSKILYRLGLDHSLANDLAPTINQLLQRRNDVAHGVRRDGLEETDYLQLERAVNSVTDRIVATITSALQTNLHLRSSA